MQDLRIEKAKVEDLIPYANNAKIHTDKQVQQIANSIVEFGNCDPIAVWTNDDGKMEIVEGHGRLMALRELNIPECPVIRLDHLTDEQRRAYTHVHNQLTVSTGWDFDALEIDMNELDFDFADFGFEMVDFEPKAKYDAKRDADEISIEEFSKEKFDCECPRCGMRFNLK